jgi:hypothetical protein
VFGLIFTAVGLVNTGRTLQTAQQGQITDRYTKAVDQLGSTDPAVRLGGIYALERLTHDSPSDQTTIMKVLVSYIRLHARDASPPASTRTSCRSTYRRRCTSLGTVTRATTSRDSASTCRRSISITGI